MKASRTGIILNTENYTECVHFYKSIFALEIIYQEEFDEKSKLTCFDFQGSYLMVETGGIAQTSGKTISQNATKLRFNVSNIEQAQKELQQHGIDAKIQDNSWGATINIFDPDGNRIGIRDQATFERQVSMYTNSKNG